MNNSVCALIVTYNRKEYLVKLLHALSEQSYSIKKILIFDNHSSDGTAELLQKEGYISNIRQMALISKFFNRTTFLYFQNDENSGGSGGFHDGIDIACKQECDYIWAMDDDVLPDKECLSNLMKYISENAKVSIPCRTDENFIDYAVENVNMSNPFLYKINTRKKKVKSDQIRKNYINVKDMPFEGPLFSKSLVKQIGLPNQDFFIIFDDSEYALRASKVTELRYIPSAILHKQIIPKKEPRRLMGWKEYYGYRNQIYFDRTYGENLFVKLLRPIFLLTDLSCRAVLKRKWSNLRILRKAYHDGIKGILGMAISPGEKI